MKMFLTSVCAVLLAAVSSSCTSGNTGYNTGNVAINLGGPVPGLAIGGGGGQRGYAPPHGLRPMKSCPPQCRVTTQGGHRIVCDPRGRRIGYLPPQNYGGQGYAGSSYGGGYRPQPGYGGGSNYPRPQQNYQRPPDRPQGPSTIYGSDGAEFRAGYYTDSMGGQSTAIYRRVDRRTD